VADVGTFTACIRMLCSVRCSLSHSNGNHISVGTRSGKIVCPYTNFFTIVKNNVCRFSREASSDAEPILVHPAMSAGVRAVFAT
jgi:hypothetical protein